MEALWWDRDFTATIRDYEFTRMAGQRIRSVTESRDFEDMDADMIFDLLFSEFEMVSFRDYLKRYLYERAGFQEAFREVPDSTYREIIEDSFELHRAPHSFTPTSTKWSVTVKSWLTRENVQRSTVFLLGFGLGMSDSEVSEFLTKVIQEADFDEEDERELVFRYCFRKQLPYAAAREYLDFYGQLPAGKEGKEKTETGLSFPENEEELRERLRRLKKTGTKESRAAARQDIVARLYRACQERIADLYEENEAAFGGKKEWQPEEIGAADLEKMLYDGVPVTENGNLQKMSSSLLNRQFQQKRLTRQHLDSLLKGKIRADRYDLLTLQFFLSAQSPEEDPKERCLSFLDEAGRNLKSCGMGGVHLANSYEAFILMCLLSEDPLLTWYDVWERSYEEAEDD